MSSSKMPLGWRIRRFLRRIPDALDISRLWDKMAERRYKKRARKDHQRLRALDQDERPARAPQPAPAPVRDGPPLRVRLAFRWKRYRWRIILLVLVVGLGIGAMPLWQRYRVWRTDSLIRDAGKAVDQRDWKEAYQSAASALLLRNSDREAQWLLFQAMRALNNPNAVEVGYVLDADPTLPEDRRLAVVEYFADHAPEAAFFGSFGRLDPKFREIDSYRAPFIRVLTRRGDFRNARALLQSATDSKTSPLLGLEWVRLGCRMGGLYPLVEARNAFLRLKAQKAPQALEAVRLLHEIPGGLKVDAGSGLPDLTEWLDSLAEATVADRLIARDQRLSEGAAVEAVATEAITRYGSQDPGVVGTWLNRHGQHRECLALTAGPAASSPEAFSALINAQVALRMTAEAEASLKRPPAGVTKTDLTLLNVKLASLKDPSQAGDAWKAAVKSISENAAENRGLEVAKLAAEAGRKEEELEATIASLRHSRGALPVYDRADPVMARLAASRRLTEMLEICTNLVRYEPGNPVLLNNLLYLEMLLGRKPASAVVPGLKELYAKKPMAEAGLSLAMAHLAAGQAAEALTVIKGFPPKAPCNTALRDAIVAVATRVVEAPPPAPAPPASSDTGTTPPEKTTAAAPPEPEKPLWPTGVLLPEEDLILQRALASIAPPPEPEKAAPKAPEAAQP